MVASISALSAPDPSMVNAYMYQPGAGSGQAAQQGQAVPTTTPAYSSYQPTPTQGYQASEGSLPVAEQLAASWGEGWGILQGWHNSPRLSDGISEREGEVAGWSQISGSAVPFAVGVGWGQSQFWAPHGAEGRRHPGSSGVGRVVLVLGHWFEMSHRCLHHLSPASPPQSAASQSQSIPAISQAPQSGAMGYMGSQSVSMGYQPYGMQVSTRCHTGPFLGTGGDKIGWSPARGAFLGLCCQWQGRGEAWRRLWAFTSALRALCVPQPL